MDANQNGFKLLSLCQNYFLQAVLAASLFAVITAAIQWTSMGHIFAEQQYSTLAIYALMAVALAVSLFRHNQIQHLKSDIARRSGNEIELSHDALCANSIVTHTDPNGIVIWANDNFLETYGFKRDEIIGSSIARIYPNSVKNPTYQEIRDCLTNGQIWFGHSEEIRADGSSLFVEGKIIPIHDEDGQLIRAVSIRTDQSRLEHVRGIKDVFDHLQDEIYIYDSESLQMVYANLKANECAGWDSEHLGNYTIIDANEQMNEAAFRAHTAPLVAGQKDSVSINVKRGATFGEISTRLHHSKNGRVMFMSIIRDTTARVKAEQARKDFVSTASHELRSPLTSIKGSLLLLESGTLGEFEAKAKAVLSIAVRNVDQLMSVVDDILDMHKLQAGMMEMAKEPTDLVKFLNSVLEMNKGYADIHNVNLSLNTDLISASQNIDPARMTQVMSNLMSNAIKYSPDKGTVQVNFGESDKRYRIEVVDNGPGIPKAAFEKIFRGFEQIEAADGKERKGTGLGLAIAKSIVQAHNGKIGLESEVGKGTTFYIELPKEFRQIDEA